MPGLRKPSTRCHVYGQIRQAKRVIARHVLNLEATDPLLLTALLKPQMKVVHDPQLRVAYLGCIRNSQCWGCSMLQTADIERKRGTEMLFTRQEPSSGPPGFCGPTALLSPKIHSLPAFTTGEVLSGSAESKELRAETLQASEGGTCFV